MIPAAQYFSDLISRNKAGEGAGVCSVCSANALVIAAAMEHCRKTGGPLLVEATANQVNQFGGYTGMRPEDFVGYVRGIAEERGFDPRRILFGGDHLGPLVWAGEPEASAMEKAEALVSAFAAAGFQKIHLDCSMRLGSDDPEGALPVRTVAERAARLARAAENSRPAGCLPVYVVGSEVPIPGGATSHEDSLAVTSPEAMEEELAMFREAFLARGLEDAWSRVIAMVVQPGVEFGDDQVFLYDPDKAGALTACARKYRNLTMEGHSTDYQPASCLAAMKRDGVAILKVGPALTFAMRSALFALEDVERRMPLPSGVPSRFEETLEAAMLADPGNWIRHYHGSEEELALMRRYSLSDRCRYYLDAPSVRQAQSRLLENLSGRSIPMGLLAQYFPRQCREVLAGALEPTPENLVLRQIQYVLETYEG